MPLKSWTNTRTWRSRFKWNSPRQKSIRKHLNLHNPNNISRANPKQCSSDAMDVSSCKTDVYIERQVRRGGWNLPHSEWHNPFKLYDYGGSRSVMLNRYERYIRKERPDLWKKLPELEGKTLGCWCKPFQCHGDVLQKLVMERKQRDNLRQ